MKKIPGKKIMTFDEWLAYGVTRDWNSSPICHTHDGFPKDSDTCLHYILVYKNLETADNIMDEFPPATWRSHTRNLKWED
jgi:hypothetical protein